ncbi:MAG: hypothetical protein WC176_08180 [Candidatus Cloacimonadaceae bacterium]
MKSGTDSAYRHLNNRLKRLDGRVKVASEKQAIVWDEKLDGVKETIISGLADIADDLEELFARIDSMASTVETFDDRITLNADYIHQLKVLLTTAEEWITDTDPVIAQQGGDIASINTTIGDMEADIAGIEGDLARETETRDNQFALALGFDKVITISHRIETVGNGYVTTTDDLSWLQIGRVVAITLPDVGPYYYLAKLIASGKLPEDPDTTAYILRIFRSNETMNLIKVPIIPDDEIPDGAESAALPRLLLLVQKDIDSSELGGPYAQVHRYRRVEFIPCQITDGDDA